MSQPAPSPFLPGTAIQFAWDSTSVTEALACPLRYKLKIIEGWKPKNPDSAVSLIFGLLVHYGIEQYHRLRADGVPFTDAVQGALRRVLQWREDPDMPRPMIEYLPTDEEVRELKLAEAEDDESDGVDFRNSKIRTRYHLFRALIWYFEHYRQDHLKVVSLANGKAAVEHSFRVPVGEQLSDGTPLLLSGHFDKVVEFNGELYVSDVKTTKSITRTYKAGFDLSHQMTGYTVGGKIGLKIPCRGVWIDAIQLQVGGVQFQRFPTHRSESQLKEYLRLLKYVADQAEMWYQTGYYPQNTSACIFCEFKDHCRKPPEFRQQYLQTYYHQKPAWNPLRNR